MLRHVSTQARQTIFLDFLAPSIILSKRRSYSTTPERKPQPEQPQPSTKKPYFPLSPLAFIGGLRQNIPEDVRNGPFFTAERVDQFNRTVVAIRWTLKSSRNPHRLLKLWRQINSLQILHLLGHAQLVPLSNLMIETFLKSPSATVKRLVQEKEEEKEREEGSEGSYEKRGIGLLGLSPSMEKLVQNIAIVAARSDCWDAMLALTQYYIREGNATTVLSLYHKFMTLVGDEDLEIDQTFQSEVALGYEEEHKGMEETKNGLATETEFKIRPSRPPPKPAGRVQFLMAAVTAHAMQNSFQEALKVCLSTVVQLDQAQAIAFIGEALKHDSSLRNKVRLEYLPRLILAGQLSRPAAFVQFVTRLGASKSILALKNMYEVIRSGLTGEEVFLVADPSLITKRTPIALTNVVWTAILSAFLKCDRKDLAGRLWDDLTRSGITPGISMWTALLDAHGHVGAVEDALTTWDLMLQQGVQPDTLAHRAIISILFKDRRPDAAMKVFRQYESLPVKDETQHLSVYNTVLFGLCTSNREEEAEKIRDEMEKKGPKPNLVSYNTFVSYYGRRRNFQSMAATLRAMGAAGFEGDDYTYTTILNVLLKLGNKNAVELVLALMDKQGVKQKNVALYTSLIDHQLREGREDNVRVAMKILASMEQDPKNLPTDVTYTAVLCGLYRLGWMDHDELRRTEAQILEKIRRRGLSLGLPAYHLLLKACLVYPHEDGVQRAMAYYKDMKKREIPIVSTTYYILLAGLLHRGKWDFADKVVEEMYAAGVHPTGSLLRLVHDINNRKTDT